MDRAQQWEYTSRLYLKIKAEIQKVYNGLSGSSSVLKESTQDSNPRRVSLSLCWLLVLLHSVPLKNSSKSPLSISWVTEDSLRSDQIIRSVVSDSLWPHELQHARPYLLLNWEIWSQWSFCTVSLLRAKRSMQISLLLNINTIFLYVLKQLGTVQHLYSVQ